MSDNVRTIDQRIKRAMSGQRQAYRGVLKRTNAVPGVQLIQGEGLAKEAIQDAELMQHYGLTTNPPAGTMFVALPVGGKTSHSVVVATEHSSYRLVALAPGEVALYTDEGDKLVFKRGRIVELHTKVLRIHAEEAVEFDTPEIRSTGKLNAAGDIEAGGDVKAGNISVMEHVHPETGIVTGPAQPGS